MYERPTGRPEKPAPIGGKKHLPPGFDPHADAGSYHVPNQFSRGERFFNGLLALLLIGYGALGVLVDDLYVPGKYSHGIHLHGAAAWLMYGAILSGSAVLLALVIDHYDRRNNEARYLRFKRAAAGLGYLLFGFAVLWHAFLQPWQKH